MCKSFIQLETLEVSMNYAVRVNGITFPFVKFAAAEQAASLLSGATLHRILGRKGTSFVLGGAL